MGVASGSAAGINAHVGARAQDLAEKQQALAEKYMPWQIAGNTVSQAAGVLGALQNAGVDVKGLFKKKEGAVEPAGGEAPSGGPEPGSQADLLNKGQIPDYQNTGRYGSPGSEAAPAPEAPAPNVTGPEVYANLVNTGQIPAYQPPPPPPPPPPPAPVAAFANGGTVYPPPSSPDGNPRANPGSWGAAGVKNPSGTTGEGLQGSDINIKDVIAPAENLDPIDVWAKGLNPFYFTYKQGTPYDDGGVTHLGISAQELQQIPGVSSVETDERGILVVDPNAQVLVNAAVIASLCKAVLELRMVIENIINDSIGGMQAEAAPPPEPQQMAEGGPVENKVSGAASKNKSGDITKTVYKKPKAKGYMGASNGE